MARGMHRLLAKQVENAAPGTALNDGGGLSLRCTASGTKRWVFRFSSKVPLVDVKGTKKTDNRYEMGLGSYPGTTLAQARKKATDARELVAQGLNPINEARTALAVARAEADAAANATTFGKYADMFVEWKIKADRFTNPKHIYQWRHTFDHYAAELRKMQLEDVTREDVLAVLRPIWDEKHVTAARVRARLENMFDHAIQNNAYRRDNPARWELFNATLSKPRKLTNGHRPAMPRAEVPAFVAALKEREGAGALALEFLILTATRSSETREARWQEFDFVKKLWTIPASRMKTRQDKARRDHLVPLTERMLAVLEAARALHIESIESDGFVFLGAKKGLPLSDMTLRAVMRRMGVDQYVPHGFRSAFRDWAENDTEFPRELAEEALAHQLGEVERAYRREQAVERRRVLMNVWCGFLDGIPAGGVDDKVVRLRETSNG